MYIFFLCCLCLTFFFCSRFLDVCVCVCCVCVNRKELVVSRFHFLPYIGIRIYRRFILCMWNVNVKFTRKWKWKQKNFFFLSFFLIILAEPEKETYVCTWRSMWENSQIKQQTDGSIEGPSSLWCLLCVNAEQKKIIDNNVNVSHTHTHINE